MPFDCYTHPVVKPDAVVAYHRRPRPTPPTASKHNIESVHVLLRVSYLTDSHVIPFVFHSALSLGFARRSCGVSSLTFQAVPK